MRSRLSKLVPALVAVGLFAACAEERAPIDHVQPNALPKSFFVGNDLQGHDDDPEFWTRTQVIDVGYGASQDGLFTSSWGTAEMARVKFVIEENLLVARLSYERISGSDGKGAGASSTDGVVVAAFPILSHFDIKRAYNPTTGEELNILEENSSDRPWNEREYMRVDWSRNENVDSYDYDTLSLIGVFGGVVYESMAYYVNDPNSDDAPHFDAENGYFDVTTKAFARPQQIDLSYLGWGISSFPACFLDADVGGGGAPIATCNPVELTLRQGFRRVVDTDFEPQEWDGHKFKAYGGFYKDRYGYTRSYGMTDDKWHRLLSHYNLWQRSHYYSDAANMTGEVPCYTPTTTGFDGDPHRDENKDGTEDECKAVTDALGVGGSRCDSFKQKCTLPLRSREAKTIVWYATTGSNPEAFEGTDWATHDWDVALRAAVAAGRNAECVATGGKQDACDSQYPIWKGQFQDQYETIRLAWEVDSCRRKKAYDGEDCDALATRLGQERNLSAGVIAVAKMPEMVVLCHSPVQADDPEICGSPRLAEGRTAEDCYNARQTDTYDAAVLAECNAALNVRIGDIRYHTVNNIPAPQDPSAWGIMLDSNDPLTGETVSASINVWTYINDIWSQSVVDTARVIKGELPINEVTEGQYIKEYSTRASGGSGGGAVPTMNAATVANLQTALMTPAKAAEFARVGPKVPPKDVVVKAQKLNQEARLVKASINAVPTSRALYEARRKAAVGTSLEAELAKNVAWTQFAGVDPTKVDNDTLLNLSSPLRGANPALLHDIAQRREAALAERGACVLREAPAPLANAQLADVFEAKFGAFNINDDKSVQFARAERIRKYVYTKAQHSVIVHEMGHSMGLRHNFVSSADAFSFRPQYWQLRTNDGKVTERCWWTCPNGQSDCTMAGDTCVAGYCNENDIYGNQVRRETLVSEEKAATCIGPRYFDPTTPTERDNLIWMFMQDSIMDYAGETTQDLIGLGVYDYAAVRMFYGNSVAVFADSDLKFDASNKAGSAKARSLLGKMDGFGGIVGLTWDDYSSGNAEQIHYSQLQNHLGLLRSCTDVGNESAVRSKYQPATWDEARLGKWNPLVDGHFVAPDPARPGMYTVCTERPVEYVPWNVLSLPPGVSAPEGANNEESVQNTFGDYNMGGPAIDPSGRIRVPYGFATDTWADLGNLSVYRHDNGADAYELFDFFITQQETQHIFTNYRRHRQTFSVRNASNRALERYNMKMRDGAKGLALMANVYKDYSIEIGYPFEDLWPYIANRDFRPNILASAIAFDYFTRQMERPSSGPHYINFDQNGNMALASADSAGNPGYTVMTIPDGAYGVGANGSTGATGAWGNVGFGGRLLENRLGSDVVNGEYSTDYTINCGSYYDKAWTTMLLTESVDNFISDSRRDFLDARYRSVSMADLFPEGYRRWLANNMTDDNWVKAPRVPAKVIYNNVIPRPYVELPESPTGVSKFCNVDSDCGGGNKCCANTKIEVPFNTGVCIKGNACPQTCGYVDWVNEDQRDSDKECAKGTSCCQGLCSAGSCYIDSAKGLGWTTWLPSAGPQACFWSDKGLEVPGVNGEQQCAADTVALADTLPVDPQVGWEMQKFLTAMTLQYLPENQMRNWVDMMAVWELGADNDPGFDVNRIELHDPAGRVYVAKTFGMETIFGKKVQRGVAARVLQYANELLNKAYYTTPGPDLDADGSPDWYEVQYVAGQPKVRCTGGGSDCSCNGSAACITFERYVSVPAFMRQTLMTFAEGDPGMKGIY